MDQGEMWTGVAYEIRLKLPPGSRAGGRRGNRVAHTRKDRTCERTCECQVPQRSRTLSHSVRQPSPPAGATGTQLKFAQRATDRRHPRPAR